jgi:hypothetical protein
MNDIVLKPEQGEKDCFRLFVNGVDIFGKQEKSVFRHLIGVVDEGINTGL